MARAPVVLKSSEVIVSASRGANPWELLPVLPPLRTVSAVFASLQVACYAVPPHPNPRIGLTSNA